MEEQVLSADERVDTTDAENNKVMGILAYLGILVLIPILTAKESAFARFHANQGLILMLLWAATWILGMLLPWGLQIIVTLMNVAIFVLAIIGIINAVGGKMKPLPLIGNITLLK
ncbi:MAG: hypothetical protein V4642_12910 [Bacteroidota bacterium]